MRSSFTERATDRVVPFDPQLTVFDALSCDTGRVLAALDERGVRVDRTDGDR